MTRRRWVLLIVALAVTMTVVGLVFDDGSDEWHGGGGFNRTPPPRRSAVDEEAMNAGRQQFERVYARCGTIHRAQRTVSKPIGSGRGAGISTPVTELWEYRGITFEPRPKPLTQIEGFNKVTWHGDVIVSFEAERGPGRGDMLWHAGEPIVLPMQKRNGSWDPVQLLTALRQNERWSGRC